MLPDQVLSTQTFSGDFRYPRNIRRDDFTDYSLGGIDFNDSSQGLETNAWRGDLENGQITLQTSGVDPTVVYTNSGMTRFSFTFDNNMNPFIAFDTESTAHYYWYDSLTSQYVLSTLPSGSKYATCCLDDPRTRMTGSSDIILAYMRDGNLYFRAQRDRYEDEYLLETGLEGYGIRQIGLNEKLRFQFQLVPVED